MPRSNFPPLFPASSPERSAELAAATLQYFGTLAGQTSESPETNLTDLLTNLRHFCDRNGINWHRIDNRAAGHYEAETLPTQETRPDEG